MEGRLELLRNQTKVKALLKGMARYATEPFSEPFGVAVLTAGTNLSAAANRIPSRVRPFDL